MKLVYKYFENQYYNLSKKGFNSWQDELSWNINKKSFSELITKPYFPKYGNLLELGCGDGEITLFFAQHGYNSFGIDISQIALRMARQKSKNLNLDAKFIHDDVITMKKIKSNFFDIIIDGSCFHCILNEDRITFLSSISRVLKKGGFCQFRSICGDMTDEELINYYDPKTRNVINLEKDNFQFFHQGLPNEIIKEVEYAGFRILNYQILNREPKGDCDFIIIDTIKD